jgi:hypothetical protein
MGQEMLEGKKCWLQCSRYARKEQVVLRNHALAGSEERLQVRGTVNSYVGGFGEMAQGICDACASQMLDGTSAALRA